MKRNAKVGDMKQQWKNTDMFVFAGGKSVRYESWQ